MIDLFAERMAYVLTHYSIPIRPGELVVIDGSVAAEPLIDALTAAVLQRGGHPHVSVQMPNTAEILLQYGNAEQRTFHDPIQMKRLEKLDVYFRILAPMNTKNLSHFDPKLTADYQQGIQGWREIFTRRWSAGELRWCGAPWPTVAQAQDAEMGLQAYRQFVYEACGLDQEDPIRYWQDFRDRQSKLVKWLDGKKKMVMQGPGIDLTLSIAGRKWISAHGEVNFPDGEIFTSPVETEVEGQVAFNLRTVYAGHEVEGAELTFKNGVVVDAKARKGEDFLLTQLNLDAGARRLGEIAIGTNWGIQDVTGSTLFDEKIGGTIHMALGRAFAYANGVNESMVHWDMVHDMKDGGEIRVDDELIYQNGEFLIEG